MRTAMLALAAIASVASATMVHNDVSGAAAGRGSRASRLAAPPLARDCPFLGAAPPQRREAHREYAIWPRPGREGAPCRRSGRATRG